jgi:3-hydroxyisobutyrate dehydrogenase-like beta-hydroxyacid dehydrogenase
VAELPIRAATDAADAVSGAGLVVSAVTAAQDVEAARAAAAGMARGAVFLDLNSCSPSSKIEASRPVEAAGGRYVEAAVMTPIEPKRLTAPMLLGGPHAEGFDAKGYGFTGARFYSATLGQAAAAKLCRSVIIKGMEAILAESMLSARSYGVEADVLASLPDLLPGPDWPRLARYMISRSIEHGVRRAEEMREAARTVADAGIRPLMAAATVERQEWAPQFSGALAHADLEPMLDAMLAQLRVPSDRKAV